MKIFIVIISTLLCSILLTACGKSAKEQYQDMVLCNSYVTAFAATQFFSTPSPNFEKSFESALKISEDKLSRGLASLSDADMIKAYKAKLEPAKAASLERQGAELAVQHLGGSDGKPAARIISDCVKTWEQLAKA